MHRIIDAPTATLDQFARHVTRLTALRREQPIVALTRTNPLAISLIGARRTLEAAVPTLARAAWLVFLDPVEDPFFAETARRLGYLDEELEQAPIWTGPDSLRFLVISPRIESPDSLPHRMIDLVQGGVVSSGVVDKRTRELARELNDEHGLASAMSSGQRRPSGSLAIDQLPEFTTPSSSRRR